MLHKWVAQVLNAMFYHYLHEVTAEMYWQMYNRYRKTSRYINMYLSFSRVAHRNRWVLNNSWLCFLWLAFICEDIFTFVWLYKVMYVKRFYKKSRSTFIHKSNSTADDCSTHLYNYYLISNKQLSVGLNEQTTFGLPSVIILLLLL